jgi:hypothetical protein
MNITIINAFLILVIFNCISIFNGKMRKFFSTTPHYDAFLFYTILFTPLPHPILQGFSYRPPINKPQGLAQVVLSQT